MSLAFPLSLSDWTSTESPGFTSGSVMSGASQDLYRAEGRGVDRRLADMEIEEGAVLEIWGTSWEAVFVINDFVFHIVGVWIELVLVANPPDTVNKARTLGQS